MALVIRNKEKDSDGLRNRGWQWGPRVLPGDKKQQLNGEMGAYNGGLGAEEVIIASSNGMRERGLI